MVDTIEISTLNYHRPRNIKPTRVVRNPLAIFLIKCVTLIFVEFLKALNAGSGYNPTFLIVFGANLVFI